MTTLSRSSNSNPDGKCDKRIDIPVSERLEQDVIALFSLEGYGSKAEYGRSLLEEGIFGKLEMLRRRARPSESTRQCDDAPDLDDAITAMAVVRGVSQEELTREILEEAVFGRAFMLRRMTRAGRLRPSDEYPHTGGGSRK